MVGALRRARATLLALGCNLTLILSGCMDAATGESRGDDATADYLAEIGQYVGMTSSPNTVARKKQSKAAPPPAVMTPFPYNSIDDDSWAVIFNDSNKYQYPFAEKYGIAPIEDIGDAYYTRQPLTRVADCPSYGMDSLTHSVPFLVPRAAALLARIGDDYVSRLEKKGIKGWRMKVTSVLRTPASVKSLRRVNINATDSSTHKFATTFDISHVGFSESPGATPTDPSVLKTVLAQTLFDFRKREECMVKYESKTHCFHITVTK